MWKLYGKLFATQYVVTLCTKYICIPTLPIASSNILEFYIKKPVVDCREHHVLKLSHPSRINLSLYNLFALNT